MDEDPISVEAVKSEVQMIYNHFHRLPKYKYEHIVGKGANGVACLILESNEMASSLRRLVVKRGIHEAGIQGIQDELVILKWLLRAQHIVQHVVMSLTGGSSPGSPKQAAVNSKALAKKARSISGPTLITEYLQNGTLSRFIERAAKAGERIPNRILWRLFLCLIRACIAMSFPPNWPTNLAIEPETWPNTKNQNVQIIHNDINSDNVAFGDNFSGSEHNLSPILKLLDFGCAEIYDLHSAVDREALENRDVDQTNVFEIGKLMVDLVFREDSALEDGDPTHVFTYGVDECETFAVELFQRGKQPMRDPFLDGDLAILIARCVAAHKSQLPGLEELEKRVSQAVRDRTADYYLGRSEETDDYCTSFVKKLIVEPDPEAEGALLFPELEPDRS